VLRLVGLLLLLRLLLEFDIAVVHVALVKEDKLKQVGIERSSHIMNKKSLYSVYYLLVNM